MHPWEFINNAVYKTQAFMFLWQGFVAMASIVHIACYCNRLYLKKDSHANKHIYSHVIENIFTLVGIVITKYMFLC